MSRRVVTGDKARDVVQPLFLEGEARVLAYLREKGWHIADNRKAKTFYDFVINHAWVLDVKCDQLGHETGRVAFETDIDEYSEEEDEYGPHRVFQRRLEGWGRHHGLNYVAYVLVSDAEKWPLYILHRQNTLEAVLAHAEKGLAGNAVTSFTKPDGPRKASGYILALDWLEEKGCVVEHGSV